MKILLNGEYGTIHGVYWMYYGVIASFASVFLLDKGYDNYQIGIIFAVGNIISVVFQPILADVSDRSKRFTSFEVAITASGFMAVLGGMLFLFKSRSLLLSIIYALILGIFLSIQPIFNSLAFRLSESAHQVDFGAMRSVGSLCYALLCLILGTMVKTMGVNILLIVGETLLILLIVISTATKATFKNALLKVGKPYKQLNISEKPKDEGGLKAFIKNKPYFLVLNLGVMIVFLQNAVTNNFTLQIVESVGGNSEDMGRILFVMAFLEMPGLIYFSRLKRKFKLENLIIFSCFSFILKLVTMAMAGNVTVIYLAHIFHMSSFPLFLSGMITYINTLMKRDEAVKGQALFTIALTLSGVFASLFAGAVLDLMGAKALLWIASFVTAIGTVIIIYLLPRAKNESQLSI